MAFDLSDESYSDLTGLRVGGEMLEAYINASKGELTMSDTDVKCAIVSMHITLQRQLLLNEQLVERIKKLENKKPWYRFWKN